MSTHPGNHADVFLNDYGTYWSQPHPTKIAAEAAADAGQAHGGQVPCRVGVRFIEARDTKPNLKLECNVTDPDKLPQQLVIRSGCVVIAETGETPVFPSRLVNGMETEGVFVSIVPRGDLVSVWRKSLYRKRAIAELEAELERLRRQNEAMRRVLEALVEASICTGEDSETWTCLALIKEGNATTVCPRCKANQLLAALQPDANNLPD